MSIPAAALFNATVLGPLRYAPGRTVLAIAAIALGVALGFAIYLINRVAADEMAGAARSLFGSADLAVESPGDGFDEALYPQVARLPGVAVASPVVQVEAKLIGRRGALTLLGMDVLRSRQLQPAFAATSAAAASDNDPPLAGEPVFLSASAARDLRLKAGDTLHVQVGLQPQQFVVAGVLPAAALADRAGVIDIATAQWRFGRLGKISRLNLRFAPGADAAQLHRELAGILPAGVRMFTPAEAADDAARLSRAYRSNLAALALVALFTGGFFVYSTQSLAALRRRREFALLHALGVTRAQQTGLLLAGGAVIGFAGALTGVVAAVVIARVGVNMLGADLGAGYFRGVTPVIEPRVMEAAVFCILGALVAMGGTVQPALEAGRIPTAAALKAGDIASGEVRPRAALVATLFFAAAVLVWLPPVAGLPLPGYVAIALLIIGTVAAMPAILRQLLQHAPRLRAVPWEISIAHLRGTARHATLSVSAIVVSFSLMVAMAIMVTSFRHSLDAWTQRILPADIYLRAGYKQQSAHFDAEAIAALHDVEGVAAVALSRFAEVGVNGGRSVMTLIARDMDVSRAGRDLWLEETCEASVDDSTVPVWISEAAADEAGLRCGAMIDLMIAGRNVRAFIRGIWRDYEHSRGAIIMERDAYLAMSGDTAVNTVWLWLEPGVATQTVQERIRHRLPDVEYDMTTPAVLRKLSLRAFDRTFAVTYVLEIIAIAIGLSGIAAGTSAQVLARRREFGVLRHIGMTRAQIASTLAIEGAGLGALGVLAGLITGGVVSLILIHVINRQSFHWSMDLSVPAVALGALSLILIAAAALIAVISGRQAMRGDAITAVKEDW